MSIKKLITGLGFLLLYLFYSVGTQAQIPSSPDEAQKLKSKISKMGDTEEKASLMLDLGEYMINTSIDSAIAINDQSFAIADRKGYQEVILRYISTQSYLYNFLGNFEKGLSLNLKGLDIVKKNGDKAKTISMLGNTGISYSYLNEYNKALEYLQQSLQLAEEIGDVLRITKINGVMGGVLNNMSKSVSMDSTLLSKAIDYHQKALKLARQLNDSMLISDNLNGIALGYNNMEQTEKAKPYVLESVAISEKIGLTSNYAFALSTLSKILRMEGKVEEAISHAEKAVSVNQELGSVMGVVLSLKELAFNYEGAEKYAVALEKISEAERLAQENEMHYVLDGIFINKAAYLSKVKDYKSAYDYLLKGHTMADSLRGLEIKTQIHELEKKYETAKKEQEILKLTTKQKINRWIIFALVFAFVTFSIIALSTYRNIKYKNQIIEQEKEKLKADQKLQATASIIKGQEEERHRLAKDLHDGLGGMLSGLKYTLNNMGENVILTGQNVKTFEGALNMLDQAISEMRKVSHNMMPESLIRFGLDETLKDYVAKLNASLPMKIHYQSYHYHKSDQALEISIYRILQEIINNAVKHAEASDLFIQLDYKGGSISITAEDNGKGFDLKDKSKWNGIGLKNIADRVDYMNGTIEIHSTLGQGTLIVIEIKNAAL